ncbi:MAG: hypothetical protein ABEJ84_06355 [Halodesulfurarchaeum sp.]
MSRECRSHPQLDVLFEDEFSRFVADGLRPEVVMNVSPDRINLGIRSADGSADVFLGGLSVSEARSLKATIETVIETVEGEGGLATLTAIDPNVPED